MSNASGIASMTGFGSAEAETGIGRLTVEIRTVNHRFLDISFRMPRDFQPLEMELRTRLKEALARGKTDVSIRWIMNPELAPRVEIEEDLLREYARTVQKLQQSLTDTGPLPMEYLLQLPGVTSGSGSPDLESDKVWEALKEPLDGALASLNEARSKEGEALARAIREYLTTIGEGVDAVEAGAGEVEQRLRERLEKKIEEWKQKYELTLDEGRLETELLFYLDRSDISEELVRLRAHVESFRKKLDDSAGPIGRDLDFLTQEILREINTIGSKARDTSMTQTVVEMKAALEKIREQVQNIE